MTALVNPPAGALRRLPKVSSLAVVRVVAPLLAFATFIGMWELYIVVFEVERILLPAPHVIAARFVADFSLLTSLAWNTFVQAARGLVVGVVVSVVLAALVYRVRWLSNGFEAYAAMLKALPVVALYPICTVFFGIDAAAVIAIVAIGTAPIMFLYALRGFAGSSEHDELMASISAGPWIRFTNLVLPRSLPFLMAGLRTAAPTAVIIAIIAQYFGGRVNTLGSYIRRESGNLHTVQTWSAVLASCLLGLAVFAAVALADRFLLRWHPSRH
jgi:NitT/TauT family transport system permease protein